jgi:hypothetical protein
LISTNLILYFILLYFNIKYKFKKLRLESYPSCIEENTKSVRVVIGLEDLLRIQSYETLLKSKATTFLRLDRSAFFDVFDFVNVPILDGSSLNVNNYIGDFNPPRLLSFTISSLFIMTLTFNKPLFTQSLKLNTLRVQNGIQTSTFTPAFYFLTESFLIYADPLKLSFQVQLGDDYNRIAASSNIFKSQVCTKYFNLPFLYMIIFSTSCLTLTLHNFSLKLT